jgi:hypothetical protein
VREVLSFRFQAAVEAARLASRNLIQAVESGAERGEFARAYFGALEHLLDVYSSKENWGSDGLPLHNLPQDMAWTLKGLSGYLAVGTIPEPIADCAKKHGRSEAGPDERRDIRVAVGYIKAVKAGVLDDRSPTASVAAAYDVKKRTVQGWSAAHSDVDPAAVAHGHPEFLASLMKKAGQRYRRAGRSAAAIERRASKRG